MANDSSDAGEALEIDLSVPSDRRKFLSAMGVAGAAGLAGCSGGGGGSSDDTATETQTQTAGQTSTGGTGTTNNTTQKTTQGEAPMTERTLSTFIASTTADSSEPKALTEWGWAPSNYRSQYPRMLYPYLFGRKVSSIIATGERIPMLIQEWNASPTEFHYKIHEDATWSDGSDITAEDMLGAGMVGHKVGHDKPASERDTYESFGQAITGFRAEGKDYYIESEMGAFDNFWMDPILWDTIAHAGSAEFTTKGEYGQWLADQVKDKYDDLWGNQKASQYMTTEGSKTIQKSEYWPNDPKELPFSGAFKIDQILESEVRLTKNEEWLHSESINWPEVKLIQQTNSQAQNALLQNNEVEMAPLHSPSESIIDSFPKNLQEFKYAAGNSTNLLAQGQHPHFGKPPVRKALLQAIDTQQLLNIANSYTTAKISEPPGLHATQEERFVGQEFQSQFTEYPYDTEAAAERMRSAGYTKDGSTWMTPDGNRLTAELITADDNIQLEATLVSQLNSFGIDTSLTKVTSTQFGSRLDNGNFELAIENWFTGYPVWSAAILGIFYRAFQQSVRRKKWGMFPEDKTMAFVDRHDEVVNKEYSWTNNVEGIWPNPSLVNPEKQDEWVPHLKAPPIGEPNSDEEVVYPVVYWGLIWNQNISREKRKEIIRGVTWVYNQTLMPYIPILESNSLVIQDVEDWDVPEKGNKYWDQGEPQHKLIEQPQNTFQAVPKE
ncbi:MAG: ABC transporter substrate-binding protein [Halobacteriaceae archaeon]